jgi:3-methyladenine DNA glycosylase AlkC
VQQVRRDRTVREEIELDAWGHIATALRTLEKHWPKLNPEQQWSARDHLRNFAKSLSKVDPADLPNRRDEW